MSLINEMLKDLADRSQKKIKPLKLFPVMTQKNNLKLNYIHFALIFLIVLMLFFIIASLTKTKHSQSKVNPNVMTLKSFVEEKNNKYKIIPNRNAKMEPSEIKGISFEAKENSNTLSFLLNKESLYNIKTKDNKLEVFIENSILKAQKPDFGKNNIALKDLNLVDLGGKLIKIELFLEKGSEIELIDLKQSHGNSELVINLKNPFKKIEPKFVKSTNIKNNRSRLVSVKKLDSGITLQDQYQLALDYSMQGETYKASEILMEVLGKTPDSIRARKLLISLFINEGKVDTAYSIINKGLKLSPKNSDLLLMKAQILSDRGKASLALETLEKSTPLIDGYPDYYALKAALYQQKEKYPDSAILYSKLVEINPDNSTWWLGLGISMENLKRNKEALHAYNKANINDNLSYELQSYLSSRLKYLKQHKG